MRRLICLSIALLASGSLAVAQTTDAPRWQTTIQVGVQAGQVRPDVNTNNGGWYYPYYPVRPAGNRYSLSIYGTTNYAVRSWLRTGLSAGIDWYSQTQLFPVAASLEGRLPKKNQRVSPFVNLESGYAFRGINPHGRDLSGGWLVSPGAGLRINTGNNTGFVISAGYKHQRASQRTPVDGTYTLSQVEYRHYNRIYFRMGFSF